MGVVKMMRAGVACLRGAILARDVRVRIGRNVKISGSGVLDFAPGSIIGDSVQIYVGAGATLRMLTRASVGDRSVLNVISGLSIGKGSMVSWDCQILDSDFHAILGVDGEEGAISTPIVIEDQVLLGCGTTILKGVVVRHDSVVGAGSVVSGGIQFPPYSLIAGNPARVVRTIGGWVP